MSKPDPRAAQQIAEAASAFEERLTGRIPKSVTVVLSEETLVITLHGALSAVEQALAKNPTGAAEVQEYHRQLFANSFDSLRQRSSGLPASRCRRRPRRSSRRPAPW